MTHQQRTALQRYAAAYRNWRTAPEATQRQRESAIPCVAAFDDDLAASCTTAQFDEIRRGVDLALALDAYREAHRVVRRKGASYRYDDAARCGRAAHAAVTLGATPEQLAKALAEAER